MKFKFGCILIIGFKLRETLYAFIFSMVKSIILSETDINMHFCRDLFNDGKEVFSPLAISIAWNNHKIICNAFSITENISIEWDLWKPTHNRDTFMFFSDDGLLYKLHV